MHSLIYAFIEYILHAIQFARQSVGYKYEKNKHGPGIQVSWCGMGEWHKETFAISTCSAVIEVCMRVSDGKNKDVIYFYCHWKTVQENRCHWRQSSPVSQRTGFFCYTQRMTEGCFLVTYREERRIFLSKESSIWKGLYSGEMERKVWALYLTTQHIFITIEWQDNSQ